MTFDLLQFVAIAFITSADAIEHLANHKEPENGALIIVFAVITMLVLGAIGCMKLYINRHLHSKALEQVQTAAAGLQWTCSVLTTCRWTP